MKMSWSLALLSVALFAPGLVAQQATDKKDLPKGLMPSLGRPTSGDDQLPPFDFDAYFNGKWSVEWLVPESVLGPAGKITGTTVYKPLDGRFYEAVTDATGPGGSFTIKELIGYHKEYKSVIRQVTDSRGFSFVQLGTVGGDLGGVYDIHLESAPFTYNGKSIRLKNTIRTLSPLNYKVAAMMSVDGGPYTNYGNPWWRKAMPGTSK